MAEEQNKIALFIDADNIPAKYGKAIIESLQERGEIFIRRIYGNWEKNSLHGWNECILKYGLLAVQQMDFAVGKNATDMSLTIDAIEVLYQRQATIFAIVSGDSDFTPLAVKLRERGVYVIGLGKDQASVSFRSACNEFVDLSSLEFEQVDIKKPEVELIRKTPAPVSKILNITKSTKKMTLEERFAKCGQNGLRKPKKKLQLIHDVLRQSASLHADDKGFAPLNCAGHDLKQKKLGFGIKDFGYSLLNEFMSDFPEIYELVRTKSGGKSFRYRVKL